MTRIPTDDAMDPPLTRAERDAALDDLIAAFDRLDGAADAPPSRPERRGPALWLATVCRYLIAAYRALMWALGLGRLL